jgi:hypothetical protein
MVHSAPSQSRGQQGTEKHWRWRGKIAIALRLLAERYVKADSKWSKSYRSSLIAAGLYSKELLCTGNSFTSIYISMCLQLFLTGKRKKG